MFRVRKTWLALVALALAWTAPVGAASLSGLRAAGNDADKWILNDADFVLVVNVKQLAAAELMKKGGTDLLEAAIKSQPQARAIIDATGLQPFKDIDSILISGVLGVKTSDAKGLLVVRGRFDPANALAIARKKKDVEVIREGTFSVIKLKIRDQPAYAAFLDKTTLVVTESKKSTVSWLENGGKASARLGASLKKALGSFKGTESLTLALGITAGMKDQISKVPQLAVAGRKLQSVTASLTVTDTVALEVVGSTSDERANRQLQTALTGLKGVAEVMLQADEAPFNKKASELLDRVKISSDRNGVRITCKLSKAQIDALTGAR